MITLVPFGDVDLKAIETLTDPLADILKDRVEIGQVLPLPSSAYDSGRKQYQASMLVELLRASATRDRFLGITDQDIYAPGAQLCFR